MLFIYPYAQPVTRAGDQVGLLPACCNWGGLPTVPGLHRNWLRIGCHTWSIWVDSTPSSLSPVAVHVSEDVIDLPGYGYAKAG